MVVTMRSYDSGSELRSINILSSCGSWHQQLEARWWFYWRSLNASTLLSLRYYVAHIVVSWDIACWRGFLSYTIFLTLTITRNYFSSITLYITSSTRHSWIMLAAFNSISSQYLFDIPAGFDDLLCKVLWIPYCTNNNFTLFCHKPKFSLPLNF